MNKSETYQLAEAQLRALVTSDMSLLAKMATFTAFVFETFSHFHWAGFYLQNDSGVLEIGPYQGHLACIFIPPDKGVCGACFTQGETIIVEDVSTFPGYIACDNHTKSEIVVPFCHRDNKLGVFDVDCNDLAGFDETDKFGLENLLPVLF